MTKTTPEQFAVLLREALRKGATGPFAPIPKNKRPFYEKVIKDFERMGKCHSPSGMTASIVAMYLTHLGENFTIDYNAEFNFYSITRLDETNKKHIGLLDSVLKQWHSVGVVTAIKLGEEVSESIKQAIIAGRNALSRQ